MENNNNGIQTNSVYGGSELLIEKARNKNQSNCQKVALYIITFGFCITGLVMFVNLLLYKDEAGVNPMTSLYQIPPDFSHFTHDNQLS